MIYKPENFIIQELVPQKVFEARGEKAWELLNPKMLYSIQEIREYTGNQVVLNDYAWNGNRQNQCLRTSDFYDDLSFSQHLSGSAADPLIGEMGPDESRELIIYMKKQGKLEFVTAMEDVVNWLHIDCRPCERLNEFGLFIFEP